MKAPLIITLLLDEQSFAFFDALRKQHFPPERNFLAAHLTLFHQLPGAEPRIKKDIDLLIKHQEQIALNVTGVTFLGGGVAYKIESTELQQLHKDLQKNWAMWLFPQDNQKLWPHITVQNKVPAPIAKELYNKLVENFSPFKAWGKGLCLWEYCGGPWKHIETLYFSEL